MFKAPAPEITRIKTALLAYAARMGVTDDAAQRLLAARLWRAIPRSHNAAQAIASTDKMISVWASARVGFPITAHQLRLAVLETGADALNLLSDDNVAAFVAIITPALPMPVPLEIASDMPLQSLAKWRLVHMLRPASVAVGRTA